MKISYLLENIWLSQKKAFTLKEKAICDTLSKISGIRNVQSLAVLLESDLRIDHYELMKLEMRDVAFFAELYGKPIIRLFADYLVLKKL